MKEASPKIRKKVLLSVGGGIAAYKAVEVLRGLQRADVDVRVAMTRAATRFVQPLTFEALSHQRVHTELFPEAGDPDVLHVELAGWPDAVVVAPATADLLGKAANGLADDLVSCVLLATDRPVLAAPAMETSMFEHPPVQRNLDTLRVCGYTFIGPETGPLASGASGTGRMAEPEAVVEAAMTLLSGETLDLCDRKIVVTAGRTEEDIDPVRFITNRSTGKMGYAIADRARARGAEVTLVSGPTELSPPTGVDVLRVRSVSEMDRATREAFASADALIMTAAVLDFRPESVASGKIKKSGEGLRLDLQPTEDFLVDLGAGKGDRLVIGFAMETDDPEANAKAKLEAKQLDMIVLNDLNNVGAGFGVDTNVVTLIGRDRSEALPLMSKHDVGDRILDWMATVWGER